MKEEVSIFWFRRDLRLHDNAGFHAALKSTAPVLPVFIFDTDILNKLPETDARVTFIHQTLQKLRKKLQQQAGSSIAIYHGNPLEIFKNLIKTYHLKAVFTNTDYEPYAIKRDKEIKTFLKSRNIPFLSFKDHVIFEKDEVTKDDGTPYVVYTPYSKKWLKNLESNKIISFETQSLFHNLVGSFCNFRKRRVISKITIQTYIRVYGNSPQYHERSKLTNSCFGLYHDLG